MDDKSYKNITYWINDKRLLLTTNKESDKYSNHYDKFGNLIGITRHIKKSLDVDYNGYVSFLEKELPISKYISLYKKYINYIVYKDDIKKNRTYFYFPNTNKYFYKKSKDSVFTEIDKISFLKFNPLPKRISNNVNLVEKQWLEKMREIYENKQLELYAS